VGEDADVEHIGVGDQQPGLAADGGAMGGGSVAVVGADGDWRLEIRDQRLKVRDLIVGQRLGREKVEPVSYTHLTLPTILRV